MGSRMGYNYACLFVGYMEENILSTYSGFNLQLYKWYIDGIVGAASCRQDELEDIIMHASTFHPALHFTHTISQSLIPFLDITLSVSGSRVGTSIHYKDIDTHNYLHYTSSHCKHCKMVFPTPSSSAFPVFASKMTTSFRNARGCSPFSKVSSVTCQEVLEKRVHENKGKIPLVLTYQPLTSLVKHNLLNNLNIYNDICDPPWENR